MYGYCLKIMPQSKAIQFHNHRAAPMLSLFRTFLVLFLLFGGRSGIGEDVTDLGAKIAAAGTAKGVAPCMTCHGPDGAGMAAVGYPRIAGLDAVYLAKQLHDFGSGLRDHPVMMPMAKNLTAEEMVAVAFYYAALPIPTPTADPVDESAARIGKNLADWGDWTGRGLPACGQCHGPEGNGIGSHFPGISGQYASYLKAQLNAWRNGQRANDPLGLMKAAAERLTEAEIDAVTAYYAARPAAAPTPARNPLNAHETAAASVLEDMRLGHIVQQGPPPPGRAPGEQGYFAPPPRDALPDGQFGDMVRLGQAIFQNANVHPLSAPYVGNDQTCRNCHLDTGRLAESAPMWAAWVAYPAFRAKNQKVNTFIERIQGCFTYSLNAQASAAGAAPAADNPAIVALVSYSYWLAKGAPTGDQAMPGRGYPRLPEPRQGFDARRGERVYAAKCALCHGEDGAGVTHQDGRTLFPPLWGTESYNRGAGMHRIETAAAFIHHNMPLGLAYSLSEQEAWDVAAYINGQERPKDPRDAGDSTTKIR